MTALTLVVNIIKPAMVVSMNISNDEIIKKLYYLYRVVPTLTLCAYLIVCFVEGDRGSPKSTRRLAQEKMSLLPAMRCCTKNRPWLVYLAVQVAFYLMTVGMSDLVSVLYYIYEIQAQQLLVKGNTFLLILSLTGVAGALALPFIVSKVANRVTLMFGFTLTMALVFCAWAVLIYSPKPSLTPLFILVARQNFRRVYNLILCTNWFDTYWQQYLNYSSQGIVGSFLGAFTAILQIISNDVIDYDELISGRRREGIYKALTNVPSQFISIGMTALPQITLGVNGIKALGNPPMGKASDNALNAMRVWTTARHDSAEHFSRVGALLFTATGWIFIPAYCFAIHRSSR